jgi:ketosteroid isomerase-like protein
LLIAAAAAQAASAACSVTALRGATLEQTQAAWLERFNAHDLPCFLRFFAADATLLSLGPVDERTRRVEPDELPAYWSKMFTRLGEGRRSPGHSAARRGDNAAWTYGCSCQLSPYERCEQSWPRTLVWRQERAGWRIVHLHGSASHHSRVRR